MFWTMLEDKFYTLVFLALGIVGFFLGFMRLRRKRMVENIPTSTIRGMAMGLVELIGKAKVLTPDSPFARAPISGALCAYYEFSVERYEYRGRHSSWVTIAKGDSSSCPFWAYDDTGRVMVLPKGAEFDVPIGYQFQTGLGKEIPPNVTAFMTRAALRHKGLFGSHRLRFTEWFIQDDHDVYILGTAKKAHDSVKDHNQELAKRIEKLKTDPAKMAEVDTNKDGAISPEEWDAAVSKVERELLEETLKSTQSAQPSDVVIGRGDTEKLYMISAQSQKDFIKDLAIESSLGIFGGAAVALIALCSLASYIFAYF